MSAPEPIGYVTVRIPILTITESESWEIPEEYTYLRTGDAELVSHDIPARWHENLRDEIIESGIDLSPWDGAELAAKTTLTEEPAPAQAPPALGMNFLGKEPVT